jgi:dockerin type I repeat protein
MRLTMRILAILIISLSISAFPLLRPQPASDLGNVKAGSSPNANLGVIQTSSGFNGINVYRALALGCPSPCIPPDVSIAAGPNHIVETVNEVFAVFSKQNGALALNVSLGKFFGDQRSTHDFTDPKILFDAPSGRWFVSAIDVDLQNEAGTTVRLAASTSNDPTGSFKIYVFSAPGVDEPKLGVNDDKLVIVASSSWWVIKKSDLVNGVSKPNVQTFSIANAGVPYPVQSLSSTTTEFVATNSAPSTVRVFSITGIPPSAAVSAPLNFTVSPSFSNTIPRGVSPNGGLINTGPDARVLDTSWFQGKLWLSFNDGCTPSNDNTQRSCFRLVEIDTTASSLVQSFDVSAAGMYFFYPSLRMDSAGNLDVIFGYSANTNATCCDPSLAVTAQAVSAPINSFSPPLTIAVGGSAPDFPYGDYFGAAVDPSDTTLVWVGGEYYASSPLGWSTFIDNMRVPDFTLVVSPSVSAFPAGGSSKYNLTLTSVNGFSATTNLATTISPIVANGPTTSATPNSLTPKPGGQATSTLTVFTSSSTPTGVYIVNVTATGGSRSHSVLVTAAVTPITITISNTTTFTGVTVKTTGTLSVDSSSSSLTVSGTATVTATNSTTGVLLFSKTYTITKLLVSNSQCNSCQTKFLLNVAVIPYPLSSGITITLSGNTSSSSVQVTRNIDINQDGIVNAADQAIIQSSMQCSVGMSCYNPRADLNADGIVNIYDLVLNGIYFGATDFL